MDEPPVGPPLGRQKPRKPGMENLRVAAPKLFALGAIAVVVLGTFMTIKTHRTDQQVADLRQHGVSVIYRVANCTTGQGGLSCTGAFRYQGTTHTEAISGILNSPNNGAKLSAIMDPSKPDSFVYVRSAIYGPDAAGQSSWLDGAVVVGLLAAAMAIQSYRITAQRRHAVGTT
jgi:hypothetical protein